MHESSRAGCANNSNIQSLILRRLATVKNATVAKAIGHDEGHISRISSGERGLRIGELDAFFTTLGLRLIECDGDVSSLPSDELAALRLLARKALTQ